MADAIVVFDSHAALGAGGDVAVYMEGVAGEVPEDELAGAIAAVSARSLADGARAWSVDDVRAPGGLRLYRASVSAYFMLDPAGPRGQGDHRIAVAL